MKSIKLTFLSVTILISPQLFAESFNVTTKLTKVMAYAMNTNYDADECVLYFKDHTPSECPDKGRGVIKTDKSIGELMCSMALTAFVTGKSVTVASTDDCSSIHNSPIIRYVRVNE